MEDRLLFSAAPGPAPEASADNAQIESVIMASLEAPIEILSDGAVEESDITNAQGLQPLGLDLDTSTATHELVFIDTGAANYQDLLDDLWTHQDPDRHIDVVLLSSGEDGIAQITETLAQYRTQKLDAVHLVTHGADRAIKLGNTWLDATALEDHRDQIASWGDALNPGADLLIYGCDLAGNDLGRALLNNLVDLTGADIAASIDETGSSLLGGNWDLEYELGDVETDVAFSELTQEEYDGLLDAFSVTTTADSGVGSLRQAIADANALAGADTISFAALGTGTHTISLSSALPSITDSVVIDGWTAVSYSSIDAVPDIIINGNSTIGADGFYVSASNVTIRGLSIQRFDAAGIRLDSGSGAIIQGNWIGLNSTGTALAETAGAMADGIQIRSGNNTIGGTTLQTQNVIAGAQDGIRLRNTTATGNVIRGNIIGARPDMTGGLGNTDDGIDIGLGARDNTIGGSGPSEGNTIVSSGGNGIELRSDAGVNNRLSRNSVFASGGLGIDDQSGAIASPSLSTAASSGGTTTITGSLNSAINTTYRIEFYATPATLVDSGGGEGRLYLGTTTVTTNGSGAASISASLAVAVNHGDSVSAIAIGPTGETSHFGANLVLTGNTSELVVDTVRDVADASGFGSSLTISSLLSSRGSDGSISLREAIDAANRTGGINTIYFNLPGGGQHTINLASALPTITEGLHLNATLDSDFAGTPLVELNGSSAGSSSGLTLSGGASSSSIRGLVINRFSLNGILLDGADQVTIAGNYIGTDVTGLIDLGNGEDGVQLQNNAVNNTIGGLNAADRNVVSGNNNAGIAIDGVGSSGNTLLGNYIGLGADGATSVGNTHDGVHILGALSTVIGSSDPAGRNVISGNTINGIGINTAAGTIIRNNYIGSDSTGLLDRGNLSNGILMTGTVTGTTVGGLGVGNLISGNNAKGINLDGAGVSGATIQGNRIGSDVNGTGNLGNGQSGIEAWNGSLNNLIGGATTSLGNIVAFNGGDGVLIRNNSTGNAILSNSIFGNVESGIDLGTTGVTNNDPGDGDIGANNQMNFPVIYSVAIVGGNVTITGEARPGATVQFFEAVGTDSNGEGQTFIGSGTVTGSTAGTVDSTARQFSFTFAVGSLVGGDRVTATATDGAGSTSEFSVNANVTNLIGHWKFDADANDFSGNGYNGTLTNGSLIDTAGGTNQIGAGKLSLDGVDDYVDLTVHRSHFASLSQGTIAAWVKTSDNLGTIFELDDTADVDSYASFYTSGGNLVFEVYENDARIFGVRSTVNIHDNAWHHVAVTVDAGGNKLFIDGVQASVTYSTGSASSATFFSSVSGVDTMQIGVSQNNAGLRDRMVGLIDDVRVYNGALANSEIAALAASTTYTISGTIYEDVDGDGQVSDDGVGLASAIVSLYRDDGDGVLDAGDLIVNSIVANGSGQYSFTGLSNDTYWVVADSRSFIGSGGLNGGYTIHDQWAEQTYGSTGSVGWNGSAYTFTGTAGAHFGGMRSDRGDNGASLLTAEHVTRVSVASANVASVDYGFSYNVITNTRDGDEVGANNRTIQGSLRQFVQNSNALVTTQSSNFQIGTGAQTISLTSILDNLSDTVILDATTQEGFSGTPLIVLDGNNAAGDGFHLTATADFSTIRGFVIRDFVGDAIEIINGSDGNTIAGNYLGALTTGGTDAGATERNGESGLAISGANNTIGGSTAADRNVISANNLEGIAISGTGATGNVIVGNYIGTTASGAGDLGNGQDGILLAGGASGNTIGGVNLTDRNVISGNYEGIEITGSTTSLNVIQGNYIGVGSDGAMAIGNDFDGIHISLGAHNNTIGGSIAGARNVISASGANGIQIEGTGTDNNVVQGNFIGTDATGELDRGNASDGVRIGNGAQSNTIGGIAPEARNVISGNDGDGVDIQGSGTTGNVVQGNYIGTDDDGEQDLGNSSEGVDVSADGNTIGGSVAGAGNVISGNNLRGVYVTGAGVSATIQGNYVGTDKDGLQALGNTFDGIEVNFGAGAVSIRDNLVAANGQWGINLSGTGAGNTVDGNILGLNVTQNGVLGGTGIGASSDGHTITGNTIGGSSSYGIYLTGSANNTIQGNFIGTNSTGATGLGNAWQGIGIDGANSDDNLIGGTDSGEGNVFANNTRDGFAIASGAGTRISILGNTFRNNGGLAIDLSDNGVTDNDSSGSPDDQDVGPNGLQNFPEFSSVRLSGSDLILQGDLRTDGLLTAYRLEFYGNPAGTADATNGEGRIYLGSTTVTTDSDGRANFNVTLGAAGLVLGDSVTATATRIEALAQVGMNDFLAYGSTSEFAGNTLITASNSAPSIVASSMLNSISEDDVSNSGTLVSQMVDTEVTDTDAGALKGIAIISVPTTNGTWEYTLNGTTWLSVGTPSTTAALLLPADATTAIRFVPNSNFNGVSGLLNYKAWDQTSGTAGGTADVTFSGATTAFSTGTNGTSVSVSAVNDQPVFTGLDGAPTYVEGGAGVVLDSNVSIFDAELSAIDDFDGATLTLVRQGGANPDDALAFDGLTVTVSGTDLFVSGVQVGTYLFTGGGMSIEFGAGATNAQVNTVLQNVVYWNSSDNPPASVQLEWVFSDGNSGTQGTGGALQATGSSTVNITPTNDAPSITLMNVGGPYVEGGTPALFDSAPNLSDPDSANFDTGTLTASIVSAGTADDRITIRHQGTAAGQIGVSGNDVTYGGTVIGTWTGGTSGFTPLAITFNSQATLAAVQALAGNVQFSNVSDNPSTTSRLIRMVVTDGDGGTSNNGQNLLAVTAVNDSATISLDPNNSGGGANDDGYAVTFAEGSGPVVVVDTDATINDFGEGDIETLALSLSGFVDGAAEKITVAGVTFTFGTSASQSVTVGATTFSLSYNSGFSVISITRQGGGNMPAGDLITVLQGVAYQNTSANPTAGDRTISFFTNEPGNVTTDSATATISVTTSNNAPVISTNTLSISEGGTVVLSTSHIHATDPDNTAAQLTYTASSITRGRFELVASPGTAITSFTQAQINTGAVQFVHDGSEAAPSYQLTVSDGSLSHGPSSVSIGSFTNTNDAPVISLGQGNITHVEGTSVSTIDNAVSVTDVDSANFASGTLTVTVSGGDASDQLVVQHQGTGVGQVSVSGFNLFYDSGLGSVAVGTWSGGSGSPLVITFTSSAMAAEVEAVSKAVGFRNLSSNPSSADRTVQYQLTDGDGGTSAAVSKTIHFTTVNTGPSATGPAAVTTDVDTEVTFSSTNANAISINDPDAGVNPIEVRLSVTTGTITLASTAGLFLSVGTGVADQTLTMTGTVAAIQSAIEGLRYTPQGGFSGTDRLIVEVNDLGNSGTTGTPLTATYSVNIYIGTVPFLQGNYLELGFNGSGSLGSTLGAPAGYQSSGSTLAAESDPERDGGTYDGDFILPGSPEEGWGVHVGGTTYSNNTTNWGTNPISGNWGAVTDTGTAQSMTWNGAVAGVDISAEHTVLREGLYLEIVVTLTNTTAGTLGDIYYYRNVDPDNNYDQNSTYETTNTILSQGNDGGERAVVTATQPDGSFISLTGYGENSRVTYGGFSNRDPLAIYNGTGLSQSGSAYTDDAISLAFHVPTLAAGQSTTLTLRYTFGNEAAPDVDLDGDDSTASGLDHHGMFVEDGGPVAIVDSDMTLFDADNDVLQGMTITLTNPLDGVLESLGATTTGTNITANYDSGTGVLTLSGQATLASYRHVLSSVVYDNSANTPNTTSRVITIAVSDGTLTSPIATSTIDVLATNDPPVILTNTLTVSEGGTVVLSSVDINASDPESPSTGLTYTVSTLSGGHFESVASGATITSFTQDQVDNGGIRFVHDGGEAAPAYSLTLSDGAQSVGPSAAVISFTNVNDAPATGTASATANEDVSPILVVLGGLDVDGSITQIRVATLPANGLLYLNATMTTPVVSGTDYATTAGQLSVYFAPTPNWNGSTSFTFAAIDNLGAIDATPATATIHVTTVNDIPVVTLSAVPIEFTENSPVGLMADLVVTDVDSATLTSATISITSNFVAGEDQLVFTDMLGITGNYNSATGVLSLSGTASLADYQTALRSIAYFNPSENPTSAARHFQVVVSDGSSPSVAVTRSININAVNDAPTISSISNQTINEDTVLGPLAFTVNDNDSSNLVVTAATSDGTLIPLSNIVLNGTGANRTVTVTPAANLYGGPVTITLTVSDGSLTAQTSFDVTVQPVNDAPTVNSETFAVSETTSNGTLVGTVVAGDVDLGDTRSFSVVSGDPLGAFAINGAGQITVADASQLDFETRPTWTLTVQVRDTAGATASSTITVNLIDQNDNSPIIVSNGGGSSASISLAENTTSVTTVLATDADAGTSVQYSVSGVDAGLFQIDINTGVLSFLAAPDFENPADANGDNAHEITVIASDGVRTDSQALTITVTDANEFATTTVVDNNGSVNTVAENAGSGAQVGITAFADDLDGTDTVTYSLLNDAGGRFAIDSLTGVVTVNGALDYETGASHTIRVEALSTDGSSTFRDFTIAVTDVNEFATTAISDIDPAGETLAEDLAVGSSVGVTAFADDLDGTDAVSYSLVNSAGGRFTIDGSTGVVTLNAALDYETSTTHSIRVQAQSTDGSSTFRDFDFVVTDVNEFATSAVADADAAPESVAENAVAGTRVGITAFAHDLDGTDTVSYSLLNDAGGRFAIDSITGIVTVAGAIDYETGTSHTIRVQALGTDGSSTFRDFTIVVTDVNEFATTGVSDTDGATNAVAENSAIGAVVGVTAFADDLDGTDTVTYSLDDNAGGLVAIDPVTGVVTVNGAIDFETTSQLSFVVRATSTDSSSSTQAFTVDVVDRNDNAPIVTGGQSFPVAENSLNGTPVGTVVATDVDTVGTIQNWQIVGGTGAGAFSINPATGEITVADSSRLNFEATPTLTLQVRVSDGIQNSAVQTVAILLSDVNERPTLTGGSFALAENAASGTPVGSITASDVDAGDSLSYSIVGGNTVGAFAIDATTGQITVLDSTQLDFEATNSFTLTAQVIDQGGLTHQQSVTITLLDLNERPTLSDGTYHVPEWSALGASVGLVSASDVDAGDSLAYRFLAGNTGGRFLIDSSTGEIRVANPAGFTHESQSSFTLTVEVQDQGGLTHTAQMTVLVDNVNVPPIAVDDFYSLVQFEPLITLNLDGVLANDSDSDSPALTLTLLSGPANGTLTLNADGSFTYSSSDLFAGVDTFTYQISDGLETSQVATVSLTVGLVAPGGGGTGDGDDSDTTDNESDNDVTTEETDTEDDSEDSAGGGSSTGTTTNPLLNVTTQPRGSVDAGTPTTTQTAVAEFVATPLEPLLPETTTSTVRNIVRAIERPLASAMFPDLVAVSELVPEPVHDLTLSILQNHTMWNQLNSFRDDLNSHRESTTLMENIVVGTTTAVSGGLTVGYVIWLIRGGSLLATMMSVMPTWISFDPLPVMDQFEDDELIEDEESLASIVTGQK
jgi:parallel beta-helix repeat protein